MDCVTLLDKLSQFFEEVVSFETDPNTGKIMPNSEQYAIRTLVDRALHWLITQIAFENIPPINITLLSSGDHPDIIQALSDDRNGADVKQLIHQAKAAPNDDLAQSYLTPHFLKNFDFDNISDRLYLRARLRFSSGLLGF